MRKHADVCLILEGTYPFVTGGVSNWSHELIMEQNHLSFHLVAIVPHDAKLELKYKLPGNVASLTTIRLGELPEGASTSPLLARRLHQTLKEPLARVMSDQPLELEHLKGIVDVFKSTNVPLGQHLLLDRQEAWDQLVELYEEDFEDHSFLDYFWSYRAIAGGIYSMLLAPLPSADVYHALSTGYAGLLAARAKIETNKPAMVTEHGIYTNERRIEVVSADWLSNTASKALTIDKPRRDLRDLWIDAINNFSHICYQACDEIITLFEGNQKHQLEDGAAPSKMKVIANGVDINHYSNIRRNRTGRPTIGLIGRVVPIKDIKTYIRTVAMLKSYIPEIKAYVIGPTDENEQYYKECTTIVQMLGLEDNVTFTGFAKVDEYLNHIDVLVLTSLSEAQPLVMLEAGAVGIPLVGTDVGATREIIEGSESENPKLGRGGTVTALASPGATAEAIYQLLSDQDIYQSCSDAIKERVAKYYNLKQQHESYRDVYATYVGR